MDKVLTLLQKYRVTEYELVIWIASSLEHRMDTEECTERMNRLMEDLNVLSYHV